MTEPHERANRHPKYKAAYRVKNWASYDKALRDRGDITLWISQEAIQAPYPWRTACDTPANVTRSPNGGAPRGHMGPRLAVSYHNER